MRNFIWGKQGTSTEGSLFHKKVPFVFKLANIGDKNSPIFVYIVYTEPYISPLEINRYFTIVYAGSYVILPLKSTSKRSAMDELRKWVNVNYDGLQRFLIEKYKEGAKF